jgi:hypothetical protein
LGWWEVAMSTHVTIEICHPVPTEPGDYLVLRPGNAHPEFCRVRRARHTGELELLMARTETGEVCRPLEDVSDDNKFSKPIELIFIPEEMSPTPS